MLESWKRRARLLKREVYALYFVARDPRVPWYAKAVAAFVVAYAVSPIDLIPDFIPVLGYVDDLVIVPLGVLAVCAMIPAPVLAECRDRAASIDRRLQSWIAPVVIIAVWLTAATAAICWISARIAR